MKFSHLCLIGLISAGFALAGNAALQPRIATQEQQTVLAHVLAKNELRCGYTLWPGLLEKDPNTNQFSGPFYDYMMAVGEQLELKISWTEEVNFGDIPAALNAGRIDAFCSGAWTNAIRGKFADFITPIAYQAVTAYARADDTRFDHNPDAINQPDVKISIIDGESAETIAHEDFPKAALLALPKSASGAQMAMDVITHKADVAFIDAETAWQMTQSNPGKLRRVAGEFPLRVFGTAVVIKKGEPAFKETLDNTTRQLLMTGKIERILKRHEKHPGSYLRAQLPFQAN